MVGSDYFTIGENTIDLPRDWTTKPFVGLQVVDVAGDSAQVCPADYEDVFTAVWPGLSVACDCTEGVFSGAGRNFLLGKACP
mmetsp:Transcript_43296/g.57278  ORF Transcript_43296/g.57278 Transcript_43296/m.57278 type:complete len:82 (+) Transcript_43296:1-246(+)